MKKIIFLLIFGLGLTLSAKAQHIYAVDSASISPALNQWTADTTYLSVSFKVIEQNNPYGSTGLWYYATIPIALPNNILTSAQYDTVYARVKKWINTNYNGKW